MLVAYSGSMGQREVDIDGMLHVTSDTCCDYVTNDAPGAHDTPGCRGRVHAQGGYYGMYYICEQCQNDAKDWHPRGHFITEDMTDDVGDEGSIVVRVR